MMAVVIRGRVPLSPIMKTILDLQHSSDLGIVVLILGIIAVVLAFCGYILWDDLFRSRKKKK